jgi:hypothetical protein
VAAVAATAPKQILVNATVLATTPLGVAPTIED